LSLQREQQRHRERNECACSCVPEHPSSASYFRSGTNPTQHTKLATCPRLEGGQNTGRVSGRPHSCASALPRLRPALQPGPGLGWTRAAPTLTRESRGAVVTHRRCLAALQDRARGAVARLCPARLRTKVPCEVPWTVLRRGSKPQSFPPHRGRSLRTPAQKAPESALLPTRTRPVRRARYTSVVFVLCEEPSEPRSPRNLGREARRPASSQ
jgi:hypothetical protein